MSSPSRATVVAAVEAYVDGINRADPASLTALFSADARHHEPIGCEARTGDEIGAFFAAAVHPGLRIRPIGPVTVHEGHAVVQLDVTLEGMAPFVTTDIFEVDQDGLISYLAAVPDLEAKA